jgi:hypothetical protein
MRNWEEENIEKKPMLACYVSPACKERIKALARAKRMSISQIARELIEFALPRLEAQGEHDHSTSP